MASIDLDSAASLANTLMRGPLIGTFLSLVLYGIGCMQAFFYFQTYEHDGWRLKAMVTFLVVLETVHVALAMWVMDDYLIAHYGNVHMLQSGTWSTAGMYIIGLIIDFYVYQYFTWRIWLFTKNKWIIVPMLALSTSRAAVSIYASVLSVLQPTWFLFITNSRKIVIAGNLLFIVGDTYSACAMAYHLAKYLSWSHALPVLPAMPRPLSGPRRIDAVLNRLLVFAVATGAIVTFVDVIALILTLAQPQSLSHLSTVLIQTHLYANSLFASLNIRKAASRAYDDHHHYGFDDSYYDFDDRYDDCDYHTCARDVHDLVVVRNQNRRGLNLVGPGRRRRHLDENHRARHPNINGNRQCGVLGFGNHNGSGTPATLSLRFARPTDLTGTSSTMTTVDEGAGGEGGGGVQGAGVTGEVRAVSRTGELGEGASVGTGTGPGPGLVSCHDANAPNDAPV